MCNSLIVNGDFGNELTGWTVGGSPQWTASIGHDQLGSTYVAVGDSLAQSFYTDVPAEYMIQLWANAVLTPASVQVQIESGVNLLYLQFFPVGVVWSEIVIAVGLPVGSYLLTVGMQSGAVMVDDVWVGHIVTTRALLAEQTHAALGALALGAGYTTTPNGTMSEGSYTDGINAALRSIGACDEAGTPDIRCVTADQLDRLLYELRLAMLQKLHLFWATKTDYTLGPRTENASQIAKAIASMVGASGGGASGGNRAVYTKRLIHRPEEGSVLK